jgi:sialic acid synthase SpsE
MHIGEKIIGSGSATYFIAEVGSNYDGDLERAKSLIWLAKDCGADAVKFQHYTADSLVSDYEFTKIKLNTHQNSWENSVYSTYKQAELNIDWTSILANEALNADIDFITSPYSYAAADSVNPFITAVKIGSGDITWLEYLEHVASKGKPVILATGASNMIEVDAAVDKIIAKNKNLILMQCNTNYTGLSSNKKYTNLNVLKSFANRYPDIVLGLSDHTKGVTSILGAIALGASVIERHFTDDSTRTGPDHSFATEPDDWRQMISSARELEEMLGDGVKRVEENEKESRVVQRRSICAKRNLDVGHKITRTDFDYLRPCNNDSISPEYCEELIGKIVVQSMAKGESFRKSKLKE